MGLGSTLTSEIRNWGILAIVLVVVSIVLLKFKENDSMTTALNATVDSFITGFSEPKNWVAIVIIATIGFGLMYYFTKGKK
jgi:cell division protein FtsW (lipid II flippase)